MAETKIERRRRLQRKWYKQNRGKCIQRARDYRKENKKEIYKRQKEYANKPKVRQRIRKYGRKYYRENKKRLAKLQRERKLANPELHRIWQKKSEIKARFGLTVEEYIERTKICEIEGCNWIHTIDLHHITKTKFMAMCPNHHQLHHRKKIPIKELEEYQ